MDKLDNYFKNYAYCYDLDKKWRKNCLEMYHELYGFKKEFDGMNEYFKDNKPYLDKKCFELPSSLERNKCTMIHWNVNEILNRKEEIESYINKIL